MDFGIFGLGVRMDFGFWVRDYVSALGIFVSGL